jgi:phosphohistidine phosphatase
MSRKIIVHLVRHGKASSDYVSHVQDIDRALSEKGIINTVASAEKFISQYPTPDLIISSHAIRALHTAHIFANATGYPPEKVQIKTELYTRGEKEIYSILANLPDEIERIMITGHNPDLTLVANRLSEPIDDMRPSDVVTFSYQC